MKKTLLVLLSLLFCLCIFTACAHECEFATEWSSDATHHWHACSDAECAEVQDIASHTLVTKYSADYSKEYKECSVCGYKSAEANHAHVGGTATCTAKAVCTACNQAYGELASHAPAADAAWQKDASGHWKACASCDAKVDSAAHTPATAVEENVVNPTCNTAGSKDVVVYCSVCNYEISRTETPIPATGAHVAEDDAEWQYNETKHWKACAGTACDAHVDEADHDMESEWTYSQDKSQRWHECSVCGYKKDTEAHSHSYGAWAESEGNHVRACQDCGAVDSHAPSQGTTPTSCLNDVPCGVSGCTVPYAQGQASHAYTGAPVWTNAGNVYTASYSCQNAKCEDTNPIAITVNVQNATINHDTTATDAFKFSITPATGYYVVSVKIGDADVSKSGDSYSANIAEATIEVVMSNLYTVTWTNEDDSVLETDENVAYGTMPSFDSPEKLSGKAEYKWSYHQYQKLGWNQEIKAVSGDVTYKVKYNTVYKMSIQAISGEGASETLGAEINNVVQNTTSTETTYGYQRAPLKSVDGYNSGAACNYFSITISGIDYSDYQSVSLQFAVNYNVMEICSADGTTLFTAKDKEIHTLQVDSTGKMYIDGYDTGVTLSDGKISFRIKTNYSGEVSANYSFFYFNTLSFNQEIVAPEFLSQLADMYTNANGTKSVSEATFEQTLTYGITQMTTLTAGAWQENALSDFDLTPYQTVQFYAQRVDGGSLKIAGLSLYCDNGGAGSVIKFVKNSTGSYDLYDNGVKQNLGDTVLTNLNQIKVNIGQSGQQFRYSDVLVDADSYVAPKEFTAVSGNIYDDSALESNPSSTPDLEDKTGLEIYSYTSGGWGNTPFDDINLMSYDEVKFYVMSTTKNGSIRTNSDGGETGLITYLSDGAWKEIHLVKNSDGTGFDVYVDGVKSSTKFYTDSKKTTEIPLTNMKQFALNQNSSQAFLISNLFVYTAPSAK